MSHTQRTINAALVALGFDEQPNETLGLIAAVCRAEFLAALDACHDQGNAAAQEDRDLLQNVLCAVAPETGECLASAELNLSSERLIQLALNRPQRFASAMDILRDPAHPKRDDALVFLASCQAPLPPSAPADETPPGPTRQFRSEHVYGANHALCWNAIAGKDGVPGLMLDAANSLGGSYDWGRAAHLWLNISEVMSIYAVLRRAAPRCDFHGHGPRHDKSFSLEHQKQGLYCRVGDGRTLYGVRILPADATRVAVICFEQMFQAYPNMPPGELTALAIGMAREAQDGLSA